MSARCELYIAKVNGAHEGKLVRIDARDGSTLLARIEVPIEGFAEALLGLAAVPAKFSAIRERGPRDKPSPPVTGKEG